MKSTLLPPRKFGPLYRKMGYLFALGSLLGATSCSKQEQTAETKTDSTATKPNVIIILADDLGYSDLSSFGNEVVKTPNIDSLGIEGTRFTQAYSTAPICSPSRAAVVTGRYQQRFGFEFLASGATSRTAKTAEVSKELLSFYKKVGSEFEKNINENDYDPNAKGLPTSELTIGELFKKNGYATGLIGKWHLGEGDSTVPDQRGFDYHYGFYSGATLYAPESDPNVVSKHLPWALSEPYVWNRKNGNRIVRNGQEIDEKGFLSDRFAEEVVAFIEKNQKNPFLLYVPFNAPHDPFQAKKSDVEKYAHVQDSTKRVYYGLIASLDDAVGTINRKLKELGLDKNTVVFFSSDNGGATYTRATDNKPLRGGKLSHFEGGYSVPYFIKYPNKVPAGKVYERPVSNLDIFSTAASVAGIPLPSDREYDGVDLLPFVNGKTERPHESLFWRNGYSKSVLKGDWKLYIHERLKKQYLFDLSKDRSEKADLSKEHPEKVKELLEDLKNWEGKLKKPLWPNRINGTIEVDGEKYSFPI